MKKVTPLTPPQQRAIDVMQQARLRIQTDTVGRRFWHEVFTDADRKRCSGDYAKACPNGNVIDTWMRVRRRSEYRAIVDIAFAVGIMTPDRREWLLKEAGEQAARTPSDRPHWDRDACTLYLGSKVIRTVRSLRISARIVCILDAFESARWTTSIDDPMPKATAEDPQILRHAVASLNENLTDIRFFGNGSGGVRWAFHSTSSDG